MWNKDTYMFIITFLFAFNIIIIAALLAKNSFEEEECRNTCAPYIHYGKQVDKDKSLLCICDSKDGLLFKEVK